MSAPFFLGKVIDVIYTNPSGDFTDNLSNLCALLSGIFFCGAAANATRVYLMQTAGNQKKKKVNLSVSLAEKKFQANGHTFKVMFIWEKLPFCNC